MINVRCLIRAIFASAVCITAAAESPVADASMLESGFKAPPDSAKPRTWWHWTMGNISKEGITKDLEWMKRVGIGGFMLADVNAGRGQVLPRPIDFGTAEWLDAVRFAAVEAERLGLEMTIFSSPGWSETGGPWVKPEQAMKKLVWSETSVDGPLDFRAVLAAPPSNNGPVRNASPGGPTRDPTFYADARVLAFPTPPAEVDMRASRPVASTQAGPLDATALWDEDLNSTVTIPAPPTGGPAWVEFDFETPFTARSITLAGRGGSANGIPVGRVLASDDGQTYRTLVTLPGAQLYRQGQLRTYTFPNAVTARFFRIELTGAPLGPAQTMSQAAPPPAKSYVLAEAILHGGRVHRAEEKAGFSHLFEYESVPTPELPGDATIAKDRVIDLSSNLKSDGTLEWKVPAGRWTILRFGYSLTGAKNRPATAAGSGFEADKFSRKHMESYYHGYFEPIKAALGPLFGRSLRYVMMDSWEAGYHNWTDDMIAEFARRRGYDPTPYLPALAGRVVDGAGVTDRFLWDFRRTMADLWADNHYGALAELLQRDGVGIYGEAAGVSLEIPEDTLLNKSKVEIPMGEFWVRDLHPRLMYLQDVRGAASAAHVYGKQIVAAESFTGGGFESPATLKAVGDYWLAQGINRIVFHTSAHQPLDTKPGNVMVGTHLNRNITWAEQARPYFTYLARSSFLLQQGLPVADVAYLLNEGAPSTPPIWAAGTVPVPPPGFDFDFINADVLLNRLTTGADGRMMLPSGMSYRVLVLPETRQMRPELLVKLRELVTAGALVVGPKPISSPSLMRQPQADEEVAAVANELWGDLDGVSRTIRRFGKGTVIWGWPLDRVLAMQTIAKDFEATQAPGAELAWLHRRTEDADIYYVANVTDRPLELAARFRVSGRVPEIWRANDATMEPADYTTEGEATTVPLSLTERDAVFVVFKKQNRSESLRVTVRPIETVLATIAGPWTITFPPHLGAPFRVDVSVLANWTENEDPGVKYFSGTAAYRKNLDVPADWLRGEGRVLLDLGVVGDIAEVSVNGRRLGTLWCRPYRIDVTDALKAGQNELLIEVTNEWTNRLLGDRDAAPEKRVLNSTVTPGGIGAPPVLGDSGLIGPVKLISRSLPAAHPTRQ